MIAAAGTLALGLALAVAVYGIVASVVGTRRGSLVLIEAGRISAYSLLALVAAANALIEIAIISNDFSIAYVADNSSRTTPLFFKVLSLWSADEGSLLLWNLVLAGFIAAVAYRFRTRRHEGLPWVMAVLFAVAAFYLVLVLGPTRPFATLASRPVDGNGPLPLLQNNPLMAAHPPLLYLGFIGFTVPFAFALAALLTGSLSDEWIRLTRRWSLLAWVCLTAGLVVGGLWSYRVLGWGGYWAWDPVENVALLPWLTATAFLHSVIIQERRGMLKLWNLSLIVGTFALTTLGTFLTRGSILDSVHAFAQSAVGPLYLAFLAVVMIVGFGLIALRSEALATEGRIDAALSRESAFVGNNLVLLAFTFVVLLGTVFPLLEEAVTGNQVSVGAPYFRSMSIPLAMLLLLLAGAGPLISWRVTAWRDLARRVRRPAIAAVLTLAVLAVAGADNLAASLALSLAAFVAVANADELLRGLLAYRRAHGGGRLAAARAAVARNRRLYGGLVAHLGLAIVAVGITVSSSFAHQQDVLLGRGQVASFEGMEFRYAGTRELKQPQRTVVVATLEVRKDGTRTAALTPSLNLYPGASEPIGTPSVLVGPIRDLYASFTSFEQGGATARFRLYAIPGVLWVWVGGAVLALGGIVAAWPTRRRPPAVAQAVSTREEVVAVG